MSDTKPKRKRRSYSCGPCKLLKIKCDLTVPVCSSCIKFKRHDKCLQDPAHPPSEEEMTKIQERKKRTVIKKMKAAVAATGPSSSVPVFDPNIVSDKGDVPRLPQIIIPTSESVSPPNLSPATEYPLAEMTNKDALQLVDLSIIDVKKIKRLLPNSWNLVEELINLFYRATNHIVAQLLPQHHIMAILHTAYIKLTQTSQSLLDRPVSYLSNVMQSVQLSVVDIRAISLGLVMMSTGLTMAQLSRVSELAQVSNHLFDAISFKPAGDIIADWMQLSRSLYNRVVGYQTVTQVAFLVDWYLVSSTFYDYRHDVVQHYLEFNQVLMYCVLNDQFLTSVTKGHSSNAIDRHLRQVWAFLKVTELDTSFFSDKGSLLNGSRLRSGELPSTDMLQNLYGGVEMPGLSPLIRPFLRCIGIYFASKAVVQDVPEFIEHYLMLYSDTSLNCASLAQDFNPGSADNAGVIKASQLSQVYYLQVRWLTFIKLESGHFPSLRFTHYLVSILCMFNPFIAISQASPGAWSREMMSESIFQFRWVYSLLVYSSVFLAVVHQFRDKTGPLTASHLENLLRPKVEIVIRELEQLAPLQSITKFSDCLTIVRAWLRPHDVESPHDMATLLCYHLPPPLVDTAVNNYFGSTKNFENYINILWDLFTEMYLFDDPIQIVQGKDMDNNFINNYCNKFEGFTFTASDVSEYVEACQS